MDSVWETASCPCPRLVLTCPGAEGAVLNGRWFCEELWEEWGQEMWGGKDDMVKKPTPLPEKQTVAHMAGDMDSNLPRLKSQIWCWGVARWQKDSLA